MKTPFFAAIMFFFTVHAASAQDFAFGSITQQEISMTSYTNDPSAHAVVLNEHGQARITVVDNDDIRLVYKYHVKIKIFDSEAFKKGTVEVPLYIGKERWRR